MDSQDIPGWFDYHEIYDQAVASAPQGAMLVEIGCYMGKSFRYLLDKASEADKGLTCVAIDKWEWANYYAEVGAEIKARFPNQCQAFQHYVGNLPINVRSIIDLTDSAQGAKRYIDQSVHFAFIDAGHQYEDVKADLLAWLPKIAKGGFIAGHDYIDYHEYAAGTPPEQSNHLGVRQAVDEIIGEKAITLHRGSWIYHPWQSKLSTAIHTKDATLVLDTEDEPLFWDEMGRQGELPKLFETGVNIPLETLLKK